MRLETRCQYCKEYTEHQKLVATRQDLEKQIGLFSEVQCSNCGATDNYHVNEYVARPSRIWLILAIIFGVLAIITGVYLVLEFAYGKGEVGVSGMYFGIFSMLGPLVLVTAAILIIKGIRTSVSAFNNPKLSGEIPKVKKHRPNSTYK